MSSNLSLSLVLDLGLGGDGGVLDSFGESFDDIGGSCGSCVVDGSSGDGDGGFGVGGHVDEY